MNIAIVDDESCWRETAQKVINNYTGDKDRIEMFSSGMEFLKKDKYYDVVIMDVEMPDLNGFETITEYNKSNKNSIVIILTTHLDCARQGFLVNAFRYIDKLNMQNELEEAFGAIQKINENKYACIIGHKSNETREIPINSILYIETKSRKTLIHTEEGCFISDEKINDLGNRLEPYGFYRSHKSYLTNMAKVEYIDKEFAYFKDNEKSYVSVRKYAETKKRYIAAKKKIAAM